MFISTHKNYFKNKFEKRCDYNILFLFLLKMEQVFTGEFIIIFYYIFKNSNSILQEKGILMCKAIYR